MGGLLVQAAGVSLFASGEAYLTYLIAAVLAGAGTGMVYPTLLAFVSDCSEPEWRASALGVYRLWRDLGYAVGALGGGLAADTLGVSSALGFGAAIAVMAATTFFMRTRQTSAPA